MSRFESWKANKWFVLAALFLFVNGYGVLHIARINRAADAPVKVTSFAPGNARAIRSDEPLRWTFSAEMIPATQTGRWTASGPVTIEPATPGTFCWAAPNELRFRPSQPWRDCTPFRAEFADHLASLDGRRLSTPRTFRFQTTPLEFQEARLVEFSGDEATIQLSFTSPVSPADARHHLAIEGSTGQPLAGRILGLRESATLLLRTEPLEADERQIVVRLKRGLPGARGPLALARDARTVLPVARDLMLTKLEPVSHSFGGGEIQASFTAPIAAQTAAEFVQIEPKVDFVFRNTWYGASDNEINGAFQPGASYTVTFRKGLKSTDGRALAANITRRVYFPDRPPSISFRTSGHYLSTQGNLLLPVATMNVRRFTASVRRVYPNNLVEFARSESLQGERTRSWRYRYNDPYDVLGHPLAETEHAVESPPNEPCETRLDLRELMNGQRSGAFRVTVQPDKGERADHLVVVTDIGLAVKLSNRDLLVWANSIHTLEPIADAEVRVFSRANQELARGRTDADGLAHLTPVDGDAKPFLVTAQRGDELSFLKLDGSQVALAGDLGGQPYLDRGYEAYVFTDRGVYRPGETVHLKAIVRGKDLACPPAFPVQLHVLRPDGKRDRLLSAVLSEYGTAEFTVEIPSYAATGQYSLQLRMPGADQAIGVTGVAVEEFVPPQIAVSLRSEADRLPPGDALSFEISARHLFGRPAAGHAASARVDFVPEAFTHPSWAGYQFGDGERQFAGQYRELGNATLDADGAASFEASIVEPWRPPSALKAILSGTVRENGGRAVSASASRPVDVYPFYIGIQPARGGGTYRVGELQEIFVAAVQPGGAVDATVTNLTWTLHRVSWATVLKRDSDGRYAYQSERQVTPVATSEVLLADGRGVLPITPTGSGEYLLRLHDRPSDAASSLTFFAAVPGQELLAWSMENPERIELTFDRARYAVGDRASLLIRSPFPGKALITIESDRVLAQRVMTMTGNTASVTFPVTDACGPNVYCSVSVIRPVTPGEKWFGHRAVGVAPLLVEAPERRLQVELIAPAVIRPQSRLPLTVQVKDCDGRGVRAEVVVAAVDEGICALSDFRTPDPLGFFRAKRALGVQQFDMYALLMPEVDKTILGGASHPGGDGKTALRKRLNPISALRFRPVALWSSTLLTDENGQASIAFDVPEFTGELRLMAAAIDRERFGSAQRPVPVKRPLIVRSGIPRFLAPSDTFRLPVQVFNETGRAGEAVARVECSGPLSGAAEQRLSLRPAESKGLHFDLEAGKAPGVATVRLSVTLGEESYEERFDLPVRPAAGREIIVRAGSIAPGTAVELTPARDWLPGTAEQELVCSGMPAVRFGGSLAYLLRYPYGCLEQTTSAAFPLLYLSDLAAQLRPGSMGREETSHFVRSGVNRLLAMQGASGSFPMWFRTDTAWDWGSVYAAHFLVEAARAGYDVPQDRLDAACESLRGMLARRVPSAGNTESREWADHLALRSYACLVLALAGKPEHGWVARLAEQRQHLDLGAQVNLVAALAAAGKRRDAGELLAQVGLGAAQSNGRDLAGGLNSNVRNDAVLLAAWLEMDPNHAVVPQLVRRLESAQVNGRWHTTQENAVALMALGKYCRQLARERKPFTAIIAGHNGRSPISFDQDNQARLDSDRIGNHALRIVNDGPGVAHYYWRSEGVPGDGRSRETDNGLTARRRLLGLDGKPIGGTRLRQGDLVIVEVTLDAGGRSLDNVAVDDLLPAGLEIENPNLKTAEMVPWLTRDKPSLPIRHSDVRDDRLLAFTGAFSGKLPHYYAARAVTVGTFVWPALSASCMYDPDVRSVHGRTTLRVE